MRVERMLLNDNVAPAKKPEKLLKKLKKTETTIAVDEESDEEGAHQK